MLATPPRQITGTTSKRRDLILYTAMRSSNPMSVRGARSRASLSGSTHSVFAIDRRKSNHDVCNRHACRFDQHIGIECGAVVSRAFKSRRKAAMQRTARCCFGTGDFDLINHVDVLLGRTPCAMKMGAPANADPGDNGSCQTSRKKSHARF
jgi:hypothetical protein